MKPKKKNRFITITYQPYIRSFDARSGAIYWGIKNISGNGESVDCHSAKSYSHKNIHEEVREFVNDAVAESGLQRHIDNNEVVLKTDLSVFNEDLKNIIFFNMEDKSKIKSEIVYFESLTPEEKYNALIDAIDKCSAYTSSILTVLVSTNKDAQEILSPNGQLAKVRNATVKIYAEAVEESIGGDFGVPALTLAHTIALLSNAKKVIEASKDSENENSTQN